MEKQKVNLINKKKENLSDLVHIYDYRKLKEMREDYIYIGWEMPYIGLSRSCLYNQYHFKADLTYEEKLKQFKMDVWCEYKRKSNTDRIKIIIDCVRKVKNNLDVHLVDYVEPSKSHGEVIKNFIVYLAKEN